MDRAVVIVSNIQRGLWLVEILAPAEKGCWRVTDEHYTTSYNNARFWAGSEYPNLPVIPYRGNEGAPVEEEKPKRRRAKATE